MNKQRGIADLWLVVIGAIAILGLIAIIITAWTRYINGVDQKGFERGVKVTEAAYAKRDNEALRLKAARIEELEKSARAAEALYSEQLAVIDKKLQQERQANDAQRKRDVAAIANGAFRLRNSTDTCGSGIGLRGAGAEAGAAAGQRDGATSSELQGSAAQMLRDLFELANDADDLARQLAGAQAIIIQDRLTCNGGG